VEPTTAHHTHGSTANAHLDRIEPTTGAITAFPIAIDQKKPEKRLVLNNIVAVGPENVWFTFGGGAGSLVSGIGHWSGPGKVKLYRFPAYFANNQFVVDENGDACIAASIDGEREQNIRCVTAQGKKTSWTPVPPKSLSYLALAEEAPGEARVIWVYCSAERTGAEPCQNSEGEWFHIRYRVATLNSATHLTEDFAFTEPQTAYDQRWLEAETVGPSGDVWGYAAGGYGGEGVFRAAPGTLEEVEAARGSQMVDGSGGDVWQIGYGGSNYGCEEDKNTSGWCLVGFGGEP
jgi:hypothetical protein